MTEQLERARKSRQKPQSSVHLSKDPTAQTKAAPLHEKKKETRNVGGFGGLRKGFLSGSAPASPPNRGVKAKVQSSGSTNLGVEMTKDPGGQGAVEVTVDDVIRPKQQGSKNSGLEFPEVQEAMKESLPFLNTQS